MAQSDAVSRKNIQKAYVLLVLIILMIIVLLARQARIIDYSVLYRRLKEVDQMKDDFVSMAVHELRSPLTVIRGYVEMLGEGEGLKDAGRIHLRNIDQAAVRLSGLIGDILDVAKLQEGRMSFNPTSFDPDTVVASVVDGYQQPASAKGLTLTLANEAHTIISVDQDRFRQVVTNLVGNAVKYTGVGSVRVSTKKENGRYILRVSDTGFGISAEHQKHLFEKFYRVKSEETARIEGTGLGLWITLTMVHAMNGDISVESIEGKGSDFIVSFKAEE
jgi:signal transduction histidine kinase